MRINHVDLEHCGQETEFCVAIDVLRAFTTAAVAFARGAREILLVGTVDEMFALSHRFPEALTIGEVNGLQIEGTDFGNSPSTLMDLDLSGKRLIQRTTAGTQGIVRSAISKELLACSLCCISATVRYIKKVEPISLTLVETGVFEGGWGDEDVACADLIEAQILNKKLDLKKIIERVTASKSGMYYSDTDTDFPLDDLWIASDIDCYDFAMKVFIEAKLNILRPINNL